MIAFWTRRSLMLVIVLALALSPASARPEFGDDLVAYGTTPVRSLGIERGMAWKLAFLPEEHQLAVLLDGRVAIRQVRSGKKGSVAHSFECSAECMALSADGKRIATGHEDKSISLWDAASGKRLGQLKGHAAPVALLTFSPSGEIVASSDFQTVRWWDVHTKKELHRIAGHRDAERFALFQHEECVRAICFSPDGKSLASAEEDGAVHLYDLASGREIFSLLDRNEPRRLAFSPDGRLLAMGCSDSALHVWDVTTKKKIRRLTRYFPPDANGSGLDLVPRLAFSPDGRVLVCWGPDLGRIDRWEVATWKQLWSFEDPRRGRGVYDACFTADGTLLAAAHWRGGDDNAILLWDIAGPCRADRLKWGAFSKRQLGALWSELTNDDARPAHKALWTLVGAAEQSVPFLKERLRPIARVEPQRVVLWIDDLNSASFTVREKAQRALEAVVDQAAPLLRRALADRPSLEVTRRIERLLTLLEQAPSGDWLRALRAIAVLEYSGTVEARQALAAIAQGAPEARITQEAKAALQRLTRRPTDGDQ
ncbi:MAG: WD40 repeat domain-containing protein [Gemmataceae bacterium]|nr:WD40 repeat domain-containing protein [Gemmataceae bacterium]